MWAWAIARPTALAIPAKSAPRDIPFSRLTLTQGSGGDLDTVCDAQLGVTRGDRVDLTESLQVVHRHLVPAEVEHDVLKDTTGDISWGLQRSSYKSLRVSV
jgi:hypothetical protein